MYIFYASSSVEFSQNQFAVVTFYQCDNVLCYLIKCFFCIGSDTGMALISCQHEITWLVLILLL